MLMMAIRICSTGASPPLSTEPKTYAKAVDPHAGQSTRIALSMSELCPYLLMGECHYAEECVYIHGDMCDLCASNCLHPTDEAQRNDHIKVQYQKSLVTLSQVS